jgi:RNA polymerase sigma factor (sigma-70 family)
MAVTETGHLAARAIDDLYRRHGAEVYRYAYAVLGNHADAEDVTQTTFLNAYRALEQGVQPRKPSNWLLTISSNAIKQRFRQARSPRRTVRRSASSLPPCRRSRPNSGRRSSSASSRAAVTRRSRRFSG